MDERPQDLERLHREDGPSTWSYLRRRVHDVSLAEELFQETFLRAAENPGAIDAALSKRAWLIGIARNLLREHIRRRTRRETAPLTEEPAADEAVAEDVRVAAMRQAIQRLPDAQQEVLALRFEHEMPYAEIAASLNIPIGTVRSRLHNAIDSLRCWAGAVKH